MTDMDYDNDEPTGRVLLELTPKADDVREAIARLRWHAQQDRRDRRAMKKWAMGVIVSVIAASLTVAISIGRYTERLDAADVRLGRIEQLLLEGNR